MFVFVAILAQVFVKLASCACQDQSEAGVLFFSTMASVAALEAPMPLFAPRNNRRKAQHRTESALAPAEAPVQSSLLRQFWGRGRADAGLEEELDAAKARGDVKTLKLSLPEILPRACSRGRPCKAVGRH